MKKRSSSFANMVATLVVVTAVAGITLGFVYQYTKAPIAEAKAARQLRAIRAVTGPYTNDPLAEAYTVQRPTGGQAFEKSDTPPGATPQKGGPEALTIYPALMPDGRQMAAVSAYSFQGYSGLIELIVGIDGQGTVANVVVVSHMETPGLGSKIKDLPFIGQFLGHNTATRDLRVKQDGGDIDGISGATISSRAFGQAVTQALAAYKPTNHGKNNLP